MSIQADQKLHSLLNLNNIDHLSSDVLKEYCSKYPFSSIIQLLYTKQLKAKNDSEFNEQSKKTSLFFPFTPWYTFLLQNDFLVDNHLNVRREESDKKTEVQSESAFDEMSIPLEPYHTIDYFASQGINISHIDDKDEFGKKVKSFTAWLKTMKRLQPEQDNHTRKELESDPDFSVSDASDPETIVTEAMADVYVKQGLVEKAIEIYHKLSLQNPDNSRIFTDKILVLKEKKS
ncbi:MAG: hypothetical protein ACK5AO_09345 [bacterium]|jgi:pentatricopeptide repeat protein